MLGLLKENYFKKIMAHSRLWIGGQEGRTNGLKDSNWIDPRNDTD